LGDAQDASYRRGARFGAALAARLVQGLAEPFEPWPGSLVAALVAP